MTNKQIIIDGVDVSGCENYGETMAKTHNCTLYDGYLRPCKGADCYYKQLKRKEQECEELKAERDSWHYQWEKRYEIGECLSDKIDQLKAENKHLNDLLNQALKELEEHREAIEKIKEMCSSVENIENVNNLYESKLSGMYLQAQKILQICDEVNEDEYN